MNPSLDENLAVIAAAMGAPPAAFTDTDPTEDPREKARNIEAAKMKIRELNAQVAANQAKKTADRMPAEELEKTLKERRRLKRLLDKMQGGGGAASSSSATTLRSSVEKPFQFQKGNRGRSASVSPTRRTQKRGTSTGPAQAVLERQEREKQEALLAARKLIAAATQTAMRAATEEDRKASVARAEGIAAALRLQDEARPSGSEARQEYRRSMSRSAAGDRRQQHSQDARRAARSADSGLARDIGLAARRQQEGGFYAPLTPAAGTPGAAAVTPGAAPTTPAASAVGAAPFTPPPPQYPAAVPEGTPLDEEQSGAPYMERPGGNGQPVLNPARTVLQGISGIANLLRRSPARQSTSPPPYIRGSPFEKQGPSGG